MQSGNVRFTKIPLKYLSVRRVQIYACVNLSKPGCILAADSLLVTNCDVLIFYSFQPDLQFRSLIFQVIVIV